MFSALSALENFLDKSKAHYYTWAKVEGIGVFDFTLEQKI